MKHVLLCNPGYGNGPQLRCAELALRVCEVTGVPFTPVMPLVTTRQKQILSEEFGDVEWVFDEKLGNLIRSIGFDGISYEQFLRTWTERADTVQREAQEYVRDTYGTPAMEIARSPLLHFGTPQSYCTLFARSSDILRNSCDEEGVAIDRTLLEEAAGKMQQLEEQFTLRFITVPGTFEEVHETDIPIPPTATLREDATEVPEPSAYVSVSGIPHATVLESIDLPLLSNDPERVPVSRYASPHVLSNPNIVMHVARAGWGAVWMSLLSGTPIITAPYAQTDDPEILFNILRMEELGIGVVYRGQKDLRARLGECAAAIEQYRTTLQKRFGTLNGACFAAEKIAEHWKNPAT